MKCVVCLVLAIVALAEARVGPLGRVYQFPLSSTLQCRRVNSEGDLIVLPAPTIPVVPRDNDLVWLPQRIRFAVPAGTPDPNVLKPLLPLFNNDTTSSIQSIYPPGPTDTCTDDPRNADMASGTAPVVPDELERANDQLASLGFTSAEQGVIRGWWDTVGFSTCAQPSYEWTRLPNYYFPQYYCGGRCTGSDCSAPLGQKCMPSFREILELPVLRWDCCWDTDGNDWQWACGWRNVNIQIVTQCRCACRNILV